MFTGSQAEVPPRTVIFAKVDSNVFSAENKKRRQMR